MTAIIPFTFETSNVRVIDRDGEPWFVLADVCAILEIANSRDAAGRLDDDERADVVLTDTSSNGVSQKRNFTIINESGLWSLVIRSDKPAAKRLRKWVTSEVIPSIRKTGSYGKPDGKALLDDPRALAHAVLLACDERDAERTLRLKAEERATISDQIASEALLESRIKDHQLEAFQGSEFSITVEAFATKFGLYHEEFNDWVMYRYVTRGTIPRRIRAVPKGQLPHIEQIVHPGNNCIRFGRLTPDVFTYLVTPEGQKYFIKLYNRGDFDSMIKTNMKRSHTV